MLHPFGPLISDAWTDIHRIKHNKYRDEHPCQLPIHLLERIILMSTDENDIVLDPFVGTGTTMVAALRADRHSIGLDVDAEYCRMTAKRLMAEAANLFNRARLVFQKSSIDDKDGSVTLREEQGHYSTISS